MFILFNTLQASKAALVSLYETLRVEVGSDIGITIVTPGYIESELTKGKFLLPPEGKMGVDQDMRDVSKFNLQSSSIPFLFFSSTCYTYLLLITSLVLMKIYITLTLLITSLI